MRNAMSDRVRLYSAGPLSAFLVIILILLLIVLIPLFILGMIGAAFTRLGFSWVSAVAVVLLMLAGSFINIPVYRIQRDMVRLGPDTSSVYGVCVPRPPLQVWDTLVSINIGGTVIPLCVSLFILYRAFLLTGTSLAFLVGAGIIPVAIISFVSTRVVTHAGIQVPLFIPALTALFVSLLLGGGTGLMAAVTAVASGVTGVLLGGNIAHLNRIKDLEVPEVSIGGAGTFGAVFICCILPALIA